MKRKFYVMLFLIVCITMSAQQVIKPDLAPVKIATDEYHGITLEDPYRYMEDLNDPAVISWMKENANYANSILDRLSSKKELYDKMKELIDRRTSTIYNLNITRNDVYYFIKRNPDEEIGKLYKRIGYEGEEILFLDPTKYKEGSKETYTVSSINPSNNGDYIAIGLAPDGSENDEVIILNANGKQFKETIHLASAISWLKSGNQFLYNRLNSADLKDMKRQLNTKVYLHTLGEDPSLDKEFFSSAKNPELGIRDEEFPLVFYQEESDLMVGIAASVDKRLKLYISNPIIQKKKEWQLVVSQDDNVVEADSNEESVYYMTFKDAPNFKIVKASLKNPGFSTAETIIEESKSEIISSFQLTKDGLFYTTMKNGVEAKVYFLKHGKKSPLELKLPFTAGRASVFVKGSYSSEVWISIAGWTSPRKRYMYSPEKNTFEFQPLSTSASYPELDDLIAKEIMIKSHDGVMVPVSIIQNKDVILDGSNPALIYGYGAYGNSIRPFFSPITLAYTLYGGVLVVPHVRGGGELGDAWHRAGQKETKPNTWKDAIATAEFLIEEKYTTANRLSILGGSAGGIFVGRSITERPDLFAAASPMVGAMNTVRMEETPNGPVNTPEFGTVKDPLEFKALLEMDSYHHIKANTKYPATLITAGMNDPRVIAWEPSKFAAKLQAANTADVPILFLTDFDGGHGGRTTISTTINRFSNIFSFFYWQSGHPDFKLSKRIKE